MAALISVNVGSFSDAVFEVVSSYLTSNAGRFVAEIEAVTVAEVPKGVRDKGWWVGASLSIGFFYFDWRQFWFRYI